MPFTKNVLLIALNCVESQIKIKQSKIGLDISDLILARDAIKNEIKKEFSQEIRQNIDRDYCLFCRREIMTESGMVCQECSDKV